MQTQLALGEGSRAGLPDPTPSPNCSSGTTLEGLRTASAMVSGKGLGNWWYKWASLYPYLEASRTPVHYLKTRDISQLRELRRDLPVALEWAGSVCSEEAMVSSFAELVEGFHLSGKSSASESEEGHRVGRVGISHTLEGRMCYRSVSKRWYPHTSSNFRRGNRF